MFFSEHSVQLLIWATLPQGPFNKAVLFLSTVAYCINETLHIYSKPKSVFFLVRVAYNVHIYY